MSRPSRAQPMVSACASTASHWQLHLGSHPGPRLVLFAKPAAIRDGWLGLPSAPPRSPDQASSGVPTPAGDWPEQYNSLPVLTGARNAFESSKQMDDAVRATLASGESLYSLDIDKLQVMLSHKLRPDVGDQQEPCHAPKAPPD
jgi:hypothetical protein